MIDRTSQILTTLTLILGMAVGLLVPVWSILLAPVAWLLYNVIMLAIEARS